jgi:hypothetical protein
VAAMTQHSTDFEIEHTVPAADVLKDLPPTTQAQRLSKSSISGSC